MAVMEQVRPRDAAQTEFITEIRAGVAKMQDLVSAIESDPTNFLSITALKDTAHAIQDLSMIHGFEGVESISEKLCTTVDQALRLQSGFSRSLVLKVSGALVAISEVAELESNMEQHLTVDNVSQQAKAHRSELQDRAQQFSITVDSLVDDAEAPTTVAAPEDDPAAVTVVSDAEPAAPDFDIAEIDSVMNLTEMSEFESEDEDSGICPSEDSVLLEPE